MSTIFMSQLYKNSTLHKTIKKVTILLIKFYYITLHLSWFFDIFANILPSKHFNTHLKHHVRFLQKPGQRRYSKTIHQHPSYRQHNVVIAYK